MSSIVRTSGRLTRPWIIRRCCAGSISRHARMVALEVQSARRDDAEQVLQRREAHRRLRLWRQPRALPADHVRLELRRHAIGSRRHGRAERPRPRRHVRRLACRLGGLRKRASCRRQRDGRQGRAATDETTPCRADRLRRKMVLRRGYHAPRRSRIRAARAAHCLAQARGDLAAVMKRFSVRLVTGCSSCCPAICTQAVRHSVIRFGSLTE